LWIKKRGVLIETVSGRDSGQYNVDYKSACDSSFPKMEINLSITDWLPGDIKKVSMLQIGAISAGKQSTAQCKITQLSFVSLPFQVLCSWLGCWCSILK
jgi:hypothetical protein